MDLAGGCLYASVFVSVACAHMCVHCEVGKRIQPRGSFSFGQTDSIGSPLSHVWSFQMRAEKAANTFGWP